MVLLLLSHEDILSSEMLCLRGSPGCGRGRRQPGRPGYGWQLARQGLRFVVLEAGPELRHVWRSRWDSPKLFTFDLPVRLNARVTDLSRTEDGFEVGSADETFHARQVVVATGPFQVPFVPSPAPRLGRVGDPAQQLATPQPTGPARRPGAGRGGELRVSRSPRS
jgi:putative flavoprotein involved in K+ transport